MAFTILTLTPKAKSPPLTNAETARGEARGDGDEDTPFIIATFTMLPLPPRYAQLKMYAVVAFAMIVCGCAGSIGLAVACWGNKGGSGVLHGIWFKAKHTARMRSYGTKVATA